VTRLDCEGLQRDPLAEEPEAPTVSVTRRHRIHLLAHPVEGLVVTAGLVDAAAVPIDGGGATTGSTRTAGTTAVVMVVTARWSSWPVATPGVCTGGPKTDAEQAGGSDPGCQCRYG